MTEAQCPRIDVRVEAAVEAVYRAFAAPVPPAIHGCPCCINERGVDVLLTTPLKALTAQALWSYVSGVFYTVGSERDFKYLLPRILDTAINGPGTSIDSEIILSKVGLAKWQTWPSAQRQAIEELVDAWFERALAQDLAEMAEGGLGWTAESVLCGAALAGFPLGHWLARLQEPDVAPVLADLKQRFPKELSGFWDGAPAAFAELSEVIAAARP